MSLDEENLRNICHFCLKKGKRLKSIFENTFLVTKKTENDDLCFVDFLSLVFTNIKIQEENAFPKFVCNWCIRQVENFMTFRLTCMKSFKHLHNIQDGSNSLEPTENNKKKIKNEDSNVVKKRKDSTPTKKPLRTCSPIKINISPTSTGTQLPHLAEVIIKAEPDIDDELMQATTDLEDSLHDMSESNFNDFNDSDSKYSDDDDCWEPSEPLTKKDKKLPTSSQKKKSESSDNDNIDDEDDTKTKNKLKKHVPEKSESTICTICGGSFISMRQHIKVHSTERPFACTSCESRFKDKGTLDRHISAVHLNTRPHKCDKCGKGYNYKGGLRFHMLTHSDERNFKCEICGLTFKWVTALRKHKTTHQQNRRFECTECGKTFLTKYQLTQHSWIHTGEKPHSCKICDKRFRTAGERRVHELSVHRDVFKQETKRFRITMNTVAQNE